MSLLSHPNYASPGLREQVNLTNGLPLVLEDVHRTYETGGIEVHALRGVSLKVENAEFIAVVGPSGSGKSTLLHIIGLLDRPTHGRVFVDGTEASSLNTLQASRLRNETIGFVFQSFNLINRMTVLENVELPAIVKGTDRDLRRERARGLLSMVGLADKATRRPTQLSGGEYQRVAIARALVNDPKIVLADEPTGNLDSKTGGEVIRLFRKICDESGKSVIVVTHNAELAQASDRIISLRDGTVADERLNKA